MERSFDYTTVDQQIQKLKSQRLSFYDENVVKEILTIYGYYNIINGYRDPYIIREYDKKKYSPNVTFEQIFALFELDHSIRDVVLLSMIDLEEHLRAVCADIVAESFGSDYKKYLARNNYRDKKVSDVKFSRNKILSDMIYVAEHSHSQPIKYYREHHKIVPPWILFKGIYFGTLVNFIRLFKEKQRNKLINILYAGTVNPNNIESYKDLLSDTLFMCLEYRNLAAHGGRIYNYIPKSNIRPLNNKTQIQQGLPQLIYGLRFFKHKRPYEYLRGTLDDAVNEYCSQYPNDIPRLEQSIGVRITTKKMVWCNENTHKFHREQFCSGAKNNTYISFDEAISLKYEPCKRCCANIKIE